MISPRPFAACILGLLFHMGAHADEGGSHWAFQPVPHVVIPHGVTRDSRTPLDALHGEALKEQGLSKADRASRVVLARRLAFHLHGVPPEHRDVQDFVNDDSPNAYQRQLDRLLASPRYGERWARHWMDVARYADNKGYVFEEERRYPYAYTYRDWLVSSFNEDLPYDDFIVQQIAGDQVAKESGKPEANAAMGFLTLGRRFLNREPDIIDDRIDVVTRGLLGLTVACARCHDHKYDPIPTADYYSLYGVFASSYEPDVKPLLGEPDTTSPEYHEFLAETKKRETEIDDYFKERHAQLRTEPVLKAYFTLAHDAQDWDEPQIGKRAQSEKLYQKIAILWRDRIAKLVSEGHPAFLPWKAFADQKSLEDVKETSHPIIWAALREADAQSMNDLIAVYAKVIADANRDEPHEDAHRESLRQLLVGEDAPTGLEPEKLYRIFNTPEQQMVRKMRRKLEEYRAMSPGAPPRGMVMLDRDKPTEPHIFVRGNARSPGKQVPRQYIEVLAGKDRHPFVEGSGRYELAKAIADTNNPLTARVFVNRVWMHLMGTPMVGSPSDFGIRTESPGMARLLDRLASDFMRDGWSIKRLQREILQSDLYCQDSLANPEALEKDPENKWLTRMNRQRLDFESMRDGLLAVCEDVDFQTGGHAVDILAKPFSKRRALYGFIDRQNLPGTFRTFDIASPDAHTPRRLDTMVPQQALFIMNGPLVEQQAARLGEQALGKPTPQEAVTFLYGRLFSRFPESDEIALGSEFVADWTPSDDFTNGWEAYAHALLCSNEFMFID
jgi:hypothetical protein